MSWVMLVALVCAVAVLAFATPAYRKDGWVKLA